MLPETHGPTTIAAEARQALDELASQVVVHISTNAKGRAQFDLRFPYATIAEATERVETDITALIGEIRAALTTAGLLLAGDEDPAGAGRVESRPANQSRQRTKELSAEE